MKGLTGHFEKLDGIETYGSALFFLRFLKRHDLYLTCFFHRGFDRLDFVLREKGLGKRKMQ